MPFVLNGSRFFFVLFFLSRLRILLNAREKRPFQVY